MSIEALSDLNIEIWNNALLTWLIAGGLFVVTWLALGLFRGLLRNRLGRLADKTGLLALVVARQVVDASRGWFLLALAFFLATLVLDFEAGVEQGLSRTMIVVFLLQAGIWVVQSIRAIITAKREEELHANRDAVAAMDILSFVARVAVWAFVLLLILDNLGVNITALVAGLGVGGIAVALAAQNILSDLFASLSIVLDKPFVVGDFLMIDSFLGSVERVGIKTTRLRSLSGEQLVFANNDLLGSRVRNFGRMIERRVVFSLGVTYQTSAEQLREIPDLIRQAIEANDDVRFDRAHFQKYGDFALIFEVVYYVLSPDYNQYMDIQQAVNLSIFEDFEKNGIEFAYPTQTVFVNRTDAA